MSTRINALLGGAVVVEGELRRAFVDMASRRKRSGRWRGVEPHIPEREERARAGAGTARRRVPAP